MGRKESINRRILTFVTRRVSATSKETSIAASVLKDVMMKYFETPRPGLAGKEESALVQTSGGPGEEEVIGCGGGSCH